MNFRLPLLLSCVLLASACARDDRASDATAAALAAAAPTTAPRAAIGNAWAQAVTAHRFANTPDRGSLMVYPQQRVVRQDGAYTWYRTDLSEAHARAAVGGELRVPLPSGEELRFRFARQSEHASGDWTWVGSLNGDPSQRAIITFGAKAAFGLIDRPGQEPLRLTMLDGRSWLVETDRARLAGIVNAATRPHKRDYLIAPRAAAGVVAGEATPTVSTGASTASSTTTVDVAVGYTDGLASFLNGDSQTVTRINLLAEITNESYANSNIPARVRIVHTVKVSYPDATKNETALTELTGHTGSTSITPNAAFSALRSARDQYGADLVVLLRKFNDPENEGCGVAWINGGGAQGSIPSRSAPFGYSVVADGKDRGADGNTYLCREETFAHELGHNMGAQHDRDTADGDNNVLETDEKGVFDYALGYKTNSVAGNFFTIMAYGDSGQTRYRVFSNPRITFCGARACGIENQADNARALAQTIPQVAMFRSTVVPLAPAHVPPHLVVFAKQGGSGRTEAHRLTPTSGYTSFDRHIATRLLATGSDFAWRMLLGDFNRDGVQDLYAIGRDGASGRTEVHVLNGADGYQSFLLHSASGLGRTGTSNDWDFGLGDYNRDGSLDLFAIFKLGASGRTEVHVVNGADGFKTFLLNVATPIGHTGADGSWLYRIADWNRDGRPDVFAVRKNGTSGHTELHVLDGATQYQGYVLQTATAFGATGTTYAWDFQLGDADGDSIPDLYGIYKLGTSRTEVHILTGSSQFKTFSRHIASGLGRVSDDGAWEFALSPAG